MLNIVKQWSSIRVISYHWYLQWLNTHNFIYRSKITNQEPCWWILFVHVFVKNLNGVRIQKQFENMTPAQPNILKRSNSRHFFPIDGRKSRPERWLFCSLDGRRDIILGFDWGEGHGRHPLAGFKHIKFKRENLYSNFHFLFVFKFINK